MINIEDKGICFGYRKTVVYDTESFANHCHNHYEFYMFLDGGINYTVEDTVYSLRPCDSLLIHPRQFHFPTFSSGKPYERIVLWFDERFIPEGLSEFASGSARFFRSGADSGLCKTLFSFIAKAEKYSADDILIALRSLPADILLELKYSETETGGGIACKNPLTAKAVRYINENLSKDISLPVIASALYVSPSRLSHVFNESFPVSIMQYVRQKKILLAESLIRSGVKPAKAAVSCGFNNYTTFYRAYKQVLQKTPKE